MQDEIVKIDLDMLKKRGLSPTEKVVWFYVKFVCDTGEGFCSMWDKEIGDVLGFSDKGVQKAFGNLQSQGIVRIESTQDPRTGKVISRKIML